jgi:hypothetical protein
MQRFKLPSMDIPFSEIQKYLLEKPEVNFGSY